MALMHLLAEWSRAQGLAVPVVLTVDHGLSPGSGQAAQAVVAAARALGLAAHVLNWEGAKPNADIEAQARGARYRLMGAWCLAHAAGGLFVAHTIEDQAETFLLRLARGSGLDGLAAMRPVAPWPLPDFAPLKVVRPLLGVTRDALRADLAQRGAQWTEDPMNADPRFARVRLRDAWPFLERLELSPARIAAAAGHLARARDALEAATTQFLDESAMFEPERIVLDAAGLSLAPREIGLRALAEVLARLSGETYRPRFERLERLYDAICGGRLDAARTLHGCRIARAPRALARFGEATLVVTREHVRGSAVIAAGKEIS